MSKTCLWNPGTYRHKIVRLSSAGSWPRNFMTGPHFGDSKYLQFYSSELTSIVFHSFEALILQDKNFVFVILVSTKVLLAKVAENIFDR